MALCIDKELIVRQAVDASICEVFSTMIGEDLKLASATYVEPGLRNSESNEPALTVLLGLTGGIQGTLSLSLSERAAIQWTHALIEHETNKVDQTVIDAVGELGNMVIGGVKRRLAGNSLTMSLPTVIRANEDSLVFPTTVVPVYVLYEFGNHVMTFVIALQDK